MVGHEHVTPLEGHVAREVDTQRTNHGAIVLQRFANLCCLVSGREGGTEMIKEVTCECGFYARGSEEVLIPVVQAHARATHNMDVTTEQVIAQLKPYHS